MEILLALSLASLEPAFEGTWLSSGILAWTRVRVAAPSACSCCSTTVPLLLASLFHLRRSWRQSKEEVSVAGLWRVISECSGSERKRVGWPARVVIRGWRRV